MLHESHPGIARIKSLTRSYMWWPGMDKDIEHQVKPSSDCQSTRKDPPPVPLHPWTWPERPWSRVHIDYAGPMEGKMYLLMVDAHSRWMEVHVTNSATSTATIELLRRTFATLGLPEVVVSDNGTAFTSSEFAEFLKKNRIHHVRTPLYHPSSNGLVERAVQTFKESFKCSRQGSINTHVSRFLFKYRMTPHSSTGTSPAELMFGRKLLSQLDLMKLSQGRKACQSQDQQRKTHDKRSKFRSFYVRNYGPGPKWLPGMVVKLNVSVLLQIRLRDGRIVRPHADQLRPREGEDLGSPQPEEGGDITESQQRTEGGNEIADIEPESHPPATTNCTDQSPDTTTPREQVSECADAERLMQESNDTGAQEPASESANAEGLSPNETETGSMQTQPRRSGRVRKAPQRYEEQFP